MTLVRCRYHLAYRRGELRQSCVC